MILFLKISRQDLSAFIVKNFCLQTIHTQFSHGESELLLDNQKVASAKTPSFIMYLEKYHSHLIQDLHLCYKFEDWLISDVVAMGKVTLILFRADGDKTTETDFLKQGFILRIWSE